MEGSCIMAPGHGQMSGGGRTGAWEVLTQRQRLRTVLRSQQEWESKTWNVLVVFLPLTFSYQGILGCLSARTWENV